MAMHEFEVRISVWNEYVYTVEAKSKEDARERALRMRDDDIARFGNDDMVSIEIIDYDAPIGYTVVEQERGCLCGCKCTPA